VNTTRSISTPFLVIIGLIAFRTHNGGIRIDTMIIHSSSSDDNSALATVATAHQVDRLLAIVYIYSDMCPAKMEGGYSLVHPRFGTVAMAGISGICLNRTVYLP
jgi:hypothetical protein